MPEAIEQNDLVESMLQGNSLFRSMNEGIV